MKAVMHLVQPTDTTCAQTCAAMLLGIPVESVLCELPARKSGTKHKPLIAFLRKNGVVCDEHLRSAYRRPLPDVALVRITWPNKRGHLVLKVHDTWHDPLLPVPFTGMPKSREWSNGGRITSFIEVARSRE